MAFLKYTLYIKWFLSMRWYIIFLVLVYIISHIPFLNQNIKSFTIKTFVFKSKNETRFGWIFHRVTHTLAYAKIFNLLYPLQNSLVFLTITSSTNQLNIFMIISHGKGEMYIPRFFSCLRVLRLEDSNHEVLDKVYNFLRMTKQYIEKKDLVFIIRNYSQTYYHQQTFWNMLDDESDKEES